MPVGLVCHPGFAHHDLGDHPECQGRLTATLAHLRATGRWDRLQRFEPAPANVLQLEAVHDPRHVRRVREFSAAGPGWIEVDTYVVAGSYTAALLSAGAAVAAAERVLGGAVDAAFALARPPGHHATAGRAMGFCLFNNVAVAARYLQQVHGLERIWVLDWDVHHGNGTQDIFAADPTVLYTSLHQVHLYPGTGAAAEVGTGEGRGFTVNIPLPASTGDAGYRLAFEQVVLPVAHQFRPEFVLISAGQDCHAHDPLAHMEVTDAGLQWMAAMAADVAKRHCRGRLAACLEGGYNLQVLPAAVAAVLDGLGSPAPALPPLPGPRPQEAQAVEQAWKVQRAFWPI